MSYPIVLARPFISSMMSVSGEPSKKRKQECSDLSSGVSEDEMWADFQRFWSSSSSSRSVKDHCSRSPSDLSRPAVSSSCSSR